MKIRRRFWVALGLVLCLAGALWLYDRSAAPAPISPAAPAAAPSTKWPAGRFLDAVNEEAQRAGVRWTMHFSKNDNRVQLEIVGAEAAVDSFYTWLEQSGAQEIETLTAEAHAGGQLKLVVGYAP